MNAKTNPLGCGRSGEGAQDTTQSPDDSTTGNLPRAARRALARYEHKGCWCCGKRTVFATIGMKGKRWVAMCEKHAAQLDEVHGGAMAVFGDGGLIETAKTPWGTEDRAWFAAHPDRSHRIREVLPGEFPQEAPADLVGHVVVRQFQPGFRQRLGFAWSERLDDPPEAWCHALFDTIDDCRTRPKGEVAVIDGEAVAALAAGCYAAAGVMQ